MERQTNVADEFLALVDALHDSGLRTVPAQIAEASPGALRVMRYVHDNPGAGVQEIAQNTGLAKPTVSLLVKSLTAKGTFKRDSQKDDGRRACLYLTEDGARSYRSVKKYRREKASHLLSALDGDELATMACLMEKILDHWRKA